MWQRDRSGPSAQSWLALAVVFLFTLQSGGAAGPPQLRDTDSYLKNWDLSGATVRAAAGGGAACY